MKRSNEVAVGILVSVAVVVLILGSLWLARGGLKPGYPLYTRFAWGQNLKQGQPVLLAGVTVGYVGDVTLRREGYLDVMLRIDDKYQIPKGSTAAVKAVGIFGDVAVALTPPNPAPMTSYAIGDTVPAGPPAADIDQILSRVDSISATVSVLTHALQTQVIEAGTLKDIHRIIASTAEASAELHKVVVEQNKNFTQTFTALREGATHMSHLFDSVQVGATVDSLRALTGNGRQLLAHLDSTNTQLQHLIAQAQNPNGTVGKLLTDSLMYTDFRKLMQQADSLLEDFPQESEEVHQRPHPVVCSV